MSPSLTRGDCARGVFGGGLGQFGLSGLVCVLALVAGCSREGGHQVTLTDGPTVTRFAVRSAFAEYVELPGLRNELRLTLASYGVSCERWVPPGENDSAVTITLVTPPAVRPSATTYPWAGITESATGTPTVEPYALPKALVGKRSRLFEPGGAIRLSRVELDGHGAIAGTLAFEFPGTADRPATRLDGSFVAPLCRISLPAP